MSKGSTINDRGGGENIGCEFCFSSWKPFVKGTSGVGPDGVFVQILCVPVQVGGFSHLGTFDIRKSSTHVLTPPKIGALKEVARDNI